MNLERAFYASTGRAYELPAWRLAIIACRVFLPPNLSCRSPGLRRSLPDARLRANGAVSWAAALLPCIGTALILAFSSADSGLGRLLATPAAVYLGRISYPLYLWHWPLLAIAGQFAVREQTSFEIAAIYMMAALLAAATYHGIERPIASAWPRTSRSVRWAGPGLALFLVAAFAVLGWRARGFPERLPSDVRAILASGHDLRSTPCHHRDRRNPGYAEQCAIGAVGAKAFNFALWGDSMAASISPMVSSIADARGVKGLQISHDGCPPLLDVDIELQHAATDCRRQNDAVITLLAAQRVPRIILVANWGWYSQGRAWKVPGWPAALFADGTPRTSISLEEALLATLAKLRRAGIEPTIVGPIPEMGPWPPRELAMQVWRQAKLIEEPTRAEFLAWQARVLQTLQVLEGDGVAVVYPHHNLCDEVCHAHRNGAVFYADPEHMTPTGLAQIRPALEQLFAPPIPSGNR